MKSRNKARDQIALLPCLTLAITCDLACKKGPAATSTGDQPNVLLVTLDTTRADYLSCYGYSRKTTPTIDALAHDGIRFAHCYTPAPITLPSHTSIMTGLYPSQHKLHDNGEGVLDEKAVTLAELFRSAGYRTGAFVGAYVLHSRYGLNQGFEVYSDDFKGKGARMEDGATFAERRAVEVSDAALHWIGQKDDRPFFLWVHYFDPHGPYEPPGRPPEDTPENYAGEIAYADGELARVVRKVEELSQSLHRPAWYIVAADHGESLGDHGEPTHGFLTYNATLHVPLVIKGPGVEPGAVSDTAVSLIDLYPSLARWLGFSVPYPVSGSPLPMTSKEQGPLRPLLFETMIPLHLFGWSPLEGVVMGKEKFIHAPTDELYDLDKDPKETKNLASENKDRVAELSALLNASREPVPGVPRLSAGKRDTDPISLEKLKALGYAGSGDVPEPGTHLLDPKEMIQIVGQLRTAEQQLWGGDARGGDILTGVLTRDPNNRRALTVLGIFLRRPNTRQALIPFAQRRLEQPLPPPSDMEVPAALGAALCGEGKVDAGINMVELAEKIDPKATKVLTAKSSCLEHGGRFDDAVALWENILKQDAGSAAAYDALGDLFLHKQDFTRAVSYYTKAASLDDTNAQTQANLGNALLRLNQSAEATAAFQKALVLAPHLTPIRSKLGSLLLTQGRVAQAVEEYKLVVEALPEAPSAHYDLGVALSQTNDQAAAANEFRETLRLSPDHPDALINLGITLLRQGQAAQGRDNLIRATKIDAVAGAAHYNLAIAARRSGDSNETLAHLERAAASMPPSIPAMEELAATYVKDGKYVDAKRIMRDAVNNLPGGSPEHLKMLNSLASLLATCPDDAVRDGAEALRLARLADEKTKHGQPAILSTLASAQAENGDYAAAVQTVNQALTLMGAQQGPLKGILSRQLDEFRAGRPFRMRPAS